MTSSTRFDPCRFRDSTTRLIVGAAAACALAAVGGCATVSREDVPAPASLDGNALFAPDHDAATILEAPPVAVVDSLPREMADLEHAADLALEFMAEERWDEAQDQVFLLQDALEAPALPDSGDGDARLSSLRRQTVLMAGVLLESRHRTEAAAGSDSALAMAYGSLRGRSFPDSLVPALGAELSGMEADLLGVDNRAVDRWIAHFTGRGRRTFQTWLERKAAADSLVTAILDEHGLPRELIYLALIESGLSPRAVSSASAVGPWQFMAPTARDYGLRRSWWLDERRDMEMSTRAAADYISSLHDRFGDWALVLAAYNTGGGRIARKIRQHGHDDFWRLRLPEQTTAHIPKFIAAARLGSDPERWGFTVPEVSSLAYDVVPVDDATDLSLIARCADVPAEDVLTLNPALLRGASPPDVRGYPVRVPAGTGAKAVRALSRIPADRRLTWRRHRVERGETLGEIARRHGTSVADIARLNKLADVHRIRPGDQLLIPMPAELAAKARARASEKGHYVPPDGYVRVSYKVRQGDTLGAIARRLGVTLAHLRKVNNIHRTSLIHPGQRLFAYRPGG